MSVELIYQQGCPGLQEARHALVEALSSLNMGAEWSEWEQSDPGLPDHAKDFGSPTILVEGRDVGGQEPRQEANSCRLYPGPDGLSRAPSAEMIKEALRRNVIAPLKDAENQTKA
ncbi:hypothetical protein F6455_02880 [Proteobacteria bacterium 005FR1]|nr:hypothetical protein [Proteobacteria bacterium 005FR1]